MAARRKRTPKPPPVVTLEGPEARVRLPEGAGASMPISDLVARLKTSVPDTCGVVLPDGTKAMLPTPAGFVLVHQTPPTEFSFRWIADDSRAAYGPAAKYRTVKIGLPYVTTLAVYEGAHGGIPQLTGRNECFFSNAPLDNGGLASKLCFPALLNCSKFPDDPEHPLSWICTQNLPDEEFAGRPTLERSIRDGLKALLRHLFESGFNFSSEHHELNSWYTESVAAGIDPRIATVEKWAKATAKTPLFALDVAWLPTGRTLGQIVERIQTRGRGRPLYSSSFDFARVILNSGRATAPTGTAAGGST